MQRVAVLGVPFDANSSFVRGPAEAPQKIREALHSPAGNLSTENGLDLGEDSRWRDVGDVAYDEIESAAADLLSRDARVLALGGDHSITLPLVRAHARKHGKPTIVHLDAHPDLYDEYDGNRCSHACPFARIMEEGLAERLIQIGIRAMNAEQRRQAERFGVEVVEPSRWHAPLSLARDVQVYLSLDLDVLDPAFAPGVSHPEPGGLSTRGVLNILEKLEGRIAGADIVELNPHRDPHGLTAKVASKLLKEIVGRMLG